MWYFTFGLDHPFANYVQPINGSSEEARLRMFQVYGRNWGFQYTEAEMKDKPYKKLPVMEGLSDDDNGY